MRVLWPVRSGEYKIVQVYVNGTPDLLFGDKGTMHGQILHRILIEHDIVYDCEWIRGRSSGDSIPSMNFRRGAWLGKPAIEYRMSGAGMAEVDIDRKNVRFFGNSGDYRIGIDPKHLEDITQRETDWKLSFSE